MHHIVCSLDQVGLLEMKAMTEMTGGSLVMADSCKNAVFKKSFIKLFEGTMQANSN